MDKNQIFTTLATAVVTGLLAWAGLAARRAIKNLGQTEVDIKQRDLEAAVADLEKAHQTADLGDDVTAKAKVDSAKRALDLAERLKALADAADVDPSERTTTVPPASK